MGKDSITTSVNGVAVGTEAIATGNNKTRAEFEKEKEKHSRLINEIEDTKEKITTLEEDIYSTNNRFNIANDDLQAYTNQKEELTRKALDKAEKEKQKPVLQGELTKKEEAFNRAAEAAKNVRNSDGTFITFYDLLINLPWSVGSSNTVFAKQLKQEVDEKFPNSFSQYTDTDYERIIKDYQSRISGKAGVIRGIYDEFEENSRGASFPLNYYFDKKELNIYENNTNNNYLPDFNYNLKGSSNQNYYPSDRDKDDETLKYLHKLGARFNGDYLRGAQSLDFKLSETDYNTIPISFELENTRLLQAFSLTKSQKDKKFNALITFKYDDAIFSRLIDNYITSENNNYPLQNITKEFQHAYNKSHYDNYSLIKGVRFALKTKDGGKLAPLGVDPILTFLDELSKIKVETGGLPDSSEIYSAEQQTNDLLNEYEKIKTEYEKVDWDFKESAIELESYKKQLDHVFAYYDKVKEIITLTKEVYEESRKADRNEEEITRKNITILARRQEILDGMKDIKNFFAGIEIKYTEHARKYLEYAKEETDKFIARLNKDLKPYELHNAIIDGVNARINTLKQAYETALSERDDAQQNLNNLNSDIARLTEDLAQDADVAATIIRKQKEKDDLEKDLDRLEAEKTAAETALANAEAALRGSDFSALNGDKSYAQGYQAFASGNDAIAIGTQAQAIGNGSLAFGKQAQALKANSVAIGVGATVFHENSVALGAGSMTERGAIAQPYAAPLGGGRVAMTEVGSAGEVSVGGVARVCDQTDPTKCENKPLLRQITHVAAGAADTDAVNVWQLKKAIESLGGGASAIDPAQLNQLNSRIDRVANESKQGIANAIAVASLPQAIHPSQQGFSVATGNYSGAAALAVGYSRVSDNGKVIVKFNGSVSKQGSYSTGAGVGFFW